MLTLDLSIELRIVNVEIVFDSLFGYSLISYSLETEFTGIN